MNVHMKTYIYILLWKSLTTFGLVTTQLCMQQLTVTSLSGIKYCLVYLNLYYSGEV
jgi:hypothetical protein